MEAGRELSGLAGISAIAAVIPSYRISTSTIAKAWQRSGDAAVGLGIETKAVAAQDQDAVTLAADATREAVVRTGVEIESIKKRISAIYFGSESHPYAVKSSAAMVAASIGLGPNYTAADLEFACKAGTAGLQIVASQAKAGTIDFGLAIGADVAQSKPGDALEYSAAAAGVAVMVSANPQDWIAEITATTSYTSDTPDFWRREGAHYPEHAGRFTGEPAYFKHVIAATGQLLTQTKTEVKDYDHVVFHMPNGRFPQAVAKKLGVTTTQLELGFTVPQLGNSYSACSLVGLTAVLEWAKPGQKILLTSYGSGSGSDSFAFTVTKNITRFQKNIRKESTVKAALEITAKDKKTNGKFIDYPHYLGLQGGLNG